MPKTIEQRVEELANEKLNKLLSIVDEKLILVITPEGKVKVGGVDATPQLKANLKSEAEFFSESDLWKLINTKISHEAQRIMFVTGISLKEIEMGRSMLYLLDMQKRIIDVLKTYDPNKFA